MSASWSRSCTLGIKQKAFSWRIDGSGNLFIKRRFRRARFPRIDKVSCSHLDKLGRFMEDMEWKDLANDAAKLYMGTEKNGIGKFMYRLRPEVPYAQLSSQLATIFYYSEVWKWNERKMGMKFLLLSGNWQEKTTQYYINSLSPGDEGIRDRFLELKKVTIEGHEELDEIPSKGEQTKLSVFFDW